MSAVGWNDGSYVWLEGTPAQGSSMEETLVEETSYTRRNLGTFALKGKRVVFETMSRCSTKPPRSHVPPEMEAQMVGEFYEQHHRNWPNEPAPALGNRTPRQAARLKTVWPRLVALLKEFENRSERLRREGRPAYDFGWIWELGLERP